MRPYNSLVGKILKISGMLGLITLLTAHGNCEENCYQQCRVSSLYIGASYTRANIKIDDQSSFNGNLGGVEVGYEYAPWNNFYAGLKGSWKQGNTKNSVSERNITYIDAQERVGYTFASCCNNWSIALFSGLGFRYLGHKLKNSDDPSIKFEYNEFYIPIGFLSEYFFSPCWSLGFNFTWMPQVYPSVEITPLKGARWILQNKIGNVLVELPLTFALTRDRRFAFIFKPFYERWEDGRSTAKTSSGQQLDLPKNSYNFWGADLSFAFSF